MARPSPGHHRTSCRTGGSTGSPPDVRRSSHSSLPKVRNPGQPAFSPVILRRDRLAGCQLDRCMSARHLAFSVAMLPLDGRLARDRSDPTSLAQVVQAIGVHPPEQVRDEPGRRHHGPARVQAIPALMPGRRAPRSSGRRRERSHLHSVRDDRRKLGSTTLKRRGLTFPSMASAPGRRGSDPCGPPCAAVAAAHGAGGPTRPSSACRAACASRSPPSRTPSPAAASPRGCPCPARTGCRSAPRGPEQEDDCPGGEQAPATTKAQRSTTRRQAGEEQTCPLITGPTSG